MKLSDYIKTVLQNYSTINSSLLINKSVDGKTKLTTVYPNGAILATTEVQDQFDQKVAIYDIASFNAIISKLPDADISFDENHLTISDNSTKITVVYADTDAIVTFPEGRSFPDEVNKYDACSFVLPNEVLKKVSDFSNILGLPELRLITKKGKIYFEAFDEKKKDSSNIYSVDLNTKSEVSFTLNFKKEWLKVMPLDYKLSVCKEPMNVMFESLDKNAPMKYFIGVEKSSKIGV